MCIRIRITSAPADTYRHWDAASNTITLPATLPDTRRLWALRLILSKMAVQQPPDGARCHCGAPVRLLPRVPTQRTSKEETVMRHGA
ncbi:hypothetical protein AW27_023745 [Streptomyces sp. PCS3-D2]|uniref:hypothetical protein n=1 Tax=Streptomyces sp. PCS3-D2 TaxID=1460244 RepID=UPI000452B52B|nr:hypothetical protein [Streptomyces sp. PCS3-D2]WKV74259.1 hypothetical protein AW27_023745 [Streptomyces sp. PCS3-D2]